MNRFEVTFESAGERCAAWLYRPSQSGGTGDASAPCVVLAHGFGGVREAGLDAFAERFADAGLTALVFDYRHFGASGAEPRQLLDIGRQHEDWRAAVAFARSLDGVDPERIALWGTSFSGGHVFEVAAGDERVAAVVAQAPFLDGPRTLRLVPGPTLARLTAAGVEDELRRLRGREPRYVPLVGPPGSLAAMTSPDAEPGYRAMVPTGSPWRNEAAARIALRIGTYRPGRAAARLRCPLLVCVCDHDRVTPPDPAWRAAGAAPRGEIRRYPLGHFDIYLGEGFERAVADQIEFLDRHLLGAGGEARAEAA